MTVHYRAFTSVFQTVGRIPFYLKRKGKDEHWGVEVGFDVFEIACR